MPATIRTTALALIAATLGTAAAHAATRNLAIDASSLTVDSPCARAVTITPDPALSGHIDVLATADHPEELAQLELTHDAGARLGLPNGQNCWPSGILTTHFTPTLTLSIRVPASFPLSIDESGSATYGIGAVGALNLDLSGDAHVSVAAATDIKADISGSGDVSIASAHGALRLDQSGSANFNVAGGMLNAAKLELSGSGNVALSPVTIGDLALDNSGSAHLALASGVNRATLELSGSGDVDLNAPNLANLVLDSSGSATVRVKGNVGTAVLDLSGSGDVWLGHVTGSLTKNSSGSGTIHIGAN